MQKYKKYLTVVGCILLVTVICTLAFLLVYYIPNRDKKQEQEKQATEYYQNKLTKYQQENQTFEDYEVDVAFLGDSLTDGYDLNKFYPDYVTANRGIAGDTSSGLFNRLQISVYDLKPKVAVVLIGGNNLYNMFNDYENILLGLKQNLPNTKVVLLSLTAMGKDWAHKNQIATYNNAMIKKLALKYDFYFVDLFTPLLDETTGEIYQNYTTDGAHLTETGYQVFTNTLTPVLQSILAVNQ